ncbi:unnamed protein product [Calypogeia fissa]
MAWDGNTVWDGTVCNGVARPDDDMTDLTSSIQAWALSSSHPRTTFHAVSCVARQPECPSMRRRTEEDGHFGQLGQSGSGRVGAKRAARAGKGSGRRADPKTPNLVFTSLLWDRTGPHRGARAAAGNLRIFQDSALHDQLQKQFCSPVQPVGSEVRPRVKKVVREEQLWASNAKVQTRPSIKLTLGSGQAGNAKRKQSRSASRNAAPQKLTKTGRAGKNFELWLIWLPGPAAQTTNDDEGQAGQGSADRFGLASW